MSNEFITTPVPEKVTGFKGLSDAAHFDRLSKALLGARENALFDRAAADRVLDDLRYVAYRRGRLAAEVFLFLEQEFIDADEDLSMAQDDLNGMSRNLPFLREITAVLEEIESIREEMSEEAQIKTFKSRGGEWYQGFEKDAFTFRSGDSTFKP